MAVPVTFVCAEQAFTIGVVVGGATKLAVTFCAEFIVTVQVTLVPEHAPPQPPNVEPPVGVSVNVTSVPPG